MSAPKPGAAKAAGVNRLRPMEGASSMPQDHWPIDWARPRGILMTYRLDLTSPKPPNAPPYGLLAAPACGKKIGFVAEVAAWKLRPASETRPANQAVLGSPGLHSAMRDAYGTLLTVPLEVPLRPRAATEESIWTLGMMSPNTTEAVRSWNSTAVAGFL